MADILPTSLPDIEELRARWGGFAFVAPFVLLYLFLLIYPPLSAYLLMEIAHEAKLPYPTAACPTTS